MQERQATSRLQFQGTIQALEKELAHSMWVNQELNQKLSTSHPGGQGKGTGRLWEQQNICLFLQTVMQLCCATCRANGIVRVWQAKQGSSI